MAHYVRDSERLASHWVTYWVAVAQTASPSIIYLKQIRKECNKSAVYKETLVFVNNIRCYLVSSLERVFFRLAHIIFYLGDRQT